MISKLLKSLLLVLVAFVGVVVMSIATWAFSKQDSGDHRNPGGSAPLAKSTEGPESTRKSSLQQRHY